MKLLPLACFAASAAQSGDYDYSDVEKGYGFDGDANYDDYGNKKKNKYSSGGYGGSYDGSYGGSSYGGSSYGSTYYGRASTPHSYARALNCWPANFDTDNLMDRDANANYPYERHDYGPLHLYGSEKESKRAGTLFTNAGGYEDPPLRSGLGGHYHYGHKTAGGDHVSAPSEWVHYHSARHAGCLYEAHNFSYRSDTFNIIYHMNYFNGYYATSNNALTIAATPDATYIPNWVHIFNAHVLPKKSGGSTPHANTMPASSTDSNGIRIVIANPQYEGLGYLNFVATYKTDGFHVGDHYQEFADSTIKTNSINHATYDTYHHINDAATGSNGGTQETQGIVGDYYFDAWMGTWTLFKTTDTWETVYTEGATATTPISFTNGGDGRNHIAVSSFPHNELGKDFRFNLRIMMKGSSSRLFYYWYKINSVTITFPHYVAYALHYDGRESNGDTDVQSDGNITVSGTNAIAQGSGNFNVGIPPNRPGNDKRDNIIPPLDLGSWYDISFTHHTTSSDHHHRITGFLSALTADMPAVGATDCADWCDTSLSSFNCGLNDAQCALEDIEDMCSKKFQIHGLMNTYNERHGGQRGTYQEIWIQLQYAYRRATSSSTVNDNALEQISSPFPYLHFMAYEIEDIRFECNVKNVDNGNTCFPFTPYTTHDFGWGG